MFKKIIIKILLKNQIIIIIIIIIIKNLTSNDLFLPDGEVRGSR